jgi:ribonuclease T
MTNMKEAYISVDIEAAGPIPGAYSLLSIGACLVGQPDENYYVELQPINEAFVDAAIKVAGKSLNDFRRVGLPPDEAMKDFKAWITRVSHDSSPVFVGFNASFDWSFVNWYFHSFIGSNPFGIGGVDIKSFYMGMTGCLWQETRSSLIPREFKGETPHTHNALDDAAEQGDMFRLMLKSVSATKHV